MSRVGAFPVLPGENRTDANARSFLLFCSNGKRVRTPAPLSSSRWDEPALADKQSCCVNDVSAPRPTQTPGSQREESSLRGVLSECSLREVLSECSLRGVSSESSLSRVLEASGHRGDRVEETAVVEEFCVSGV